MITKTQTLRSLLATSFMALSLTGFQACNSGSEKSRTGDALENTGDAIEADTRETTDQMATDFQTERAKAVANLEQERDELDQKIDELQQKMDRNSNKADNTMNRQVNKLKTERQDLGNDIDKAKNATEDAWQDVPSTGRSIRRVTNWITIKTHYRQVVLPIQILTKRMNNDNFSFYA
ncbi:hypothetical protein [Spirosoma fluminis]